MAPAIVRATTVRTRRHQVERFTITQRATQHHIANGRGVADILQRIAIEYEQVGELAGFETADIRLQAKRTCAVQRGHPQHVVPRHAALRQQSHFPVIL
jgi:hypothetical protein